MSTPTEERRARIDTAVRRLGGWTAAALRLGVSENAVRGWRAAGHVPAARAIVLEAILGIPARDLTDLDLGEPEQPKRGVS
jgi:DNA-binding transcriptional regulator YdaS (Cro superfamily)